MRGRTSRRARRAVLTHVGEHLLQGAHLGRCREELRLALAVPSVVVEERVRGVALAGDDAREIREHFVHRANLGQVAVEQ
jgi:hypothetical protein